MSITTLKTPEEFIDYYWKRLQDELALKNIQVSKVGFIGFMLNMLGFMQYDIKGYYDHIFNEAFPVTAEELQNLYFHASLYGYIPPLAAPSHLVGSFKFILNVLPYRDRNVVKRDIYINDVVLNISDNDLLYTLLSKYHIVNQNDYFISTIIDTNNRSTTLNFTYSNPTLPLINFEQTKILTKEFNIPQYQFGSHYIKKINIPYDHLSQIRVFINDNEYNTEYVKNFTSGDDEVAFIRYLANSVIVEFGSGIYGKYVPNTSAKIITHVTSGEAGNIGRGVYYPTQGTVSIVDTFNNGTVSSPYTISAANFIEIQIQYSEGGKNLIDSNSLRNKLISYIRSDTNLVSERDFYDKFKDQVYSFELLFKKTSILDNSIYMHVPIRDQYMVPIHSRNITVPLSDFQYHDSTSNYDTRTSNYRHVVSTSYVNYKNDLIEYILYPEFGIDSTTPTYVSPFLYLKNKMLDTWQGYLFYDVYDQYFDTFNIYYDNVAVIPATLQFEFIRDINQFKFKFHSFQKIASFRFKFTCPQLDLVNIPMSVQDDNNVYVYLPFFIDVLDISIDVYNESNTRILSYEANHVSPIVDYSDYNTIKKYIPADSTTAYWLAIDSSSPYCIQCAGGHELPPNARISIDPPLENQYYIQFPVISKSQFDSNRKYILNNIGSIISGTIDPGNRMISDETVIKFLNTQYISKELTELVTVQKYNFPIYLPFKLYVELYPDVEYIIMNKLDFASETRTLQIELADLLSTKYTGTIISFYRTQIVDFIHNKSWVKHTDVYVFDNDNRRIPYGNIETIPNKDALDLITDKFEAVKFEPVYWWWDLNNIIIKPMGDECYQLRV